MRAKKKIYSLIICAIIRTIVIINQACLPYGRVKSNGIDDYVRYNNQSRNGRQKSQQCIRLVFYFPCTFRCILFRYNIIVAHAKPTKQL